MSNDKLEMKYVQETKSSLATAIFDLFDVGRRCGFDDESILSDIEDALANEANIKSSITID